MSELGQDRKALACLRAWLAAGAPNSPDARERPARRVGAAQTALTPTEPRSWILTAGRLPDPVRRRHSWGCAVTRMFSSRVEHLATLERAIASHASRFDKKLQREGVGTDHVTMGRAHLESGRPPGAGQTRPPPAPQSRGPALVAGVHGRSWPRRPSPGPARR